MNTVVARITVRGMLGRRRALLVLALSVPLVGLAVALRLTGHADQATALTVLRSYGLATLLPLVSLIAGTGVLGPELNDGTVVYLLSTPVSRPAIVHTKLAVAVALSALLTAGPVLVAGLLMVGGSGGVAVGLAAATLTGAVAYCAIFLCLSIFTDHAVVVGLLYALIWESLVGELVPGARAFSVQQWALSVADAIVAGHALHADLALGAALPLLAGVTVAATVAAGQRLRAISLPGEL